MGFYINENSKGEQAPAKGKEKFLIEDGAMPIPDPKEWREGLVCIVSNWTFEAAGYAYSEDEMNVFKSPDQRPKTWIEYKHAKNLSGYEKY